MNKIILRAVAFLRCVTRAKKPGCSLLAYANELQPGSFYAILCSRISRLLYTKISRKGVILWNFKIPHRPTVLKQNIFFKLWTEELTTWKPTENFRSAMRSKKSQN